MEAQKQSAIVFRFCRPSGSTKRNPSATIRQALQKLAQADEMQEFVADAHSRGRKVIAEVFHAQQGHPMLIHIAARTAKRQKK